MPPTSNVSNGQALMDELHAALKLLNSPPKEGFADIGGAPQAPDPTQANAAQQWQRKALQLLKRVHKLIQALTEQGALSALGCKAVSPQQNNVPAGDVSQVSGTTFWRDITSIASSQKRSHGSTASSGKGNPASSLVADVASAGQTGHAGKRSLIEELDTDECSQKQSPGPVMRAGVMIEELDDEEEEHAEEDKSMDKQDLRKLVLVCALHGRDHALDAPWASQESSAISLGILSRLAQALGYTKEGSRKEEGNAALATGPVQDMLLQLLPGILNDLSAIIFPAQQQDKNARFQAYRGPGTFERAKAAQQLAWLIRRLGSWALGKALGPALPCMQAAASDPSPAVQAQGLWALYHISQEASPGDLRSHKAELARATVKALVACDERAWPAAASAACGSAVALYGQDIYGEGYHAVMGEMLTQGSSYSHVPARRTVWLRAMLPLFQALGLASVCHFSQLLPLLLGWLHASDAETRLLAAQIIGHVLRQTWPRIPAHAQTLWDHLAEEHKAAEASQMMPAKLVEEHQSPGLSEQQIDGSNAEETEEGVQVPRVQHDEKNESNKDLAEAIVEAAEILWWAGGEAFREHLQQTPSETSKTLLRTLSCTRSLQSTALQATKSDC